MEDRLQALDNEVTIDFVRSGGKGGQNVNKLSTKAKLRWSVNNSNIFSQKEKENIKFFLKNRINKEGEVYLESKEERSQLQNKKRVLIRLKNLIKTALTPVKERVPTKPTRASKFKRLEEKKIQSQKKAVRGLRQNHNGY